MEYNIPDLLDCLREVNVDIQPNSGASAKRIKELTMKKIHSENKKKHRSLSAFTKVLIAAAVLASLAIPVMAATGFHVTDWLEDMFATAGEFDDSRVTGSASKNWAVSGWVFEVTGKDAKPAGMTVELDQWDTVQEKSGKLTTDESYWIEIWNGEAYEKLPQPAAKIDIGKTITIEEGSHLVWDIDWTNTYGNLESGSYRLGKNMTYTNEAGEAETVECYAKFRIFPQDMTSYIESAKAAVEELRTRDSYHLTLTDTSYGDDQEFGKCIENQWKNGEDFLEELLYFDQEGNLVAHKGYLMRHGRGYALTWKADNALSGVATWESIDWLDELNRDLWAGQFEIFDANVYEVSGEGDTTHVFMAYGFNDGWFDKLSITVSPAGKLTAAQRIGASSQEALDKAAAQMTLEVHDTTAAEIEKVITAQIVDKPVSFSWVEEQAAHPAGSEGVKTEGFVNTKSQGTVTLRNVVSIAKKECTHDVEWLNTAIVSRDEIADMWKVELRFSQDDTLCQTVYLNAEGITQLVVE